MEGRSAFSGIAQIMRTWNPKDRVPVLRTVIQEMIGFRMLRASNVPKKSQGGSRGFYQLLKGLFHEIHEEIASVLKAEGRHDDTFHSGLLPFKFTFTEVSFLLSRMSQVNSTVQTKVEEIREKIIGVSTKYFKDDIKSPTSTAKFFPDGTLYTSQQKKDILEAREREHREYIEAYKSKYKAMMTALKSLPSFTRIISQNLHCRSDAPCSVYRSDYQKCDGTNCFLDNQIERAQRFAEKIIKGTLSFDILCIQELQHDNARKKFIEVLTPHTDKFGILYDAGTAVYSDYIPGSGYLNSGLVIVYDKIKFTVLMSEIYHFPVDFSSGADRKYAKVKSFKGAIFARFIDLRVQGAENRIIFICNTHPSPYVPIESGKADNDLQIKQTHVYQFTLLAAKIKQMTLAYSQTHGQKKEFIFICGDWNINKFLQTGSLKDEENLPVSAPVKGKGKAITRSHTLFAKGEPNDNQACFRDDIPYSQKKCEAACCGSEYLTMLEVLSAAAPPHLTALPEFDNEVVAPLKGRYTWDGLFNSVSFSGYWPYPSFQLIDHIVYNKFGKIPAYAHTMTKRIIFDNPVNAGDSHGPLSDQCIGYKEAAKNATKKKLENYKSTEGSFDPKRPYNYMYYDVADHYALECCLILDDDTSTIQKIQNATTQDTTEGLGGKFLRTSFAKTKVWSKLLGFEVIPDSYTFNEELQSNISFFPRRWIENSTRYGEKNTHNKRTTQFTYTNETSNPLATNNNAAFEWRNYLPLIKAVTVGIQRRYMGGFEEFNQFCIKLLNRMIERERINRIRQGDVETLKEGKLEVLEKCSEPDLYDCLQFRQKRYFAENKTLSSRNKISKRHLEVKNQTRKNILSSLNKGNVNTLQNAKRKISGEAGTREHSILAPFARKNVFTGYNRTIENGLYKGSVVMTENNDYDLNNLF